MQKLLREPLFHFLLIGGGLFLLYSFLNPSEEQVENNVIKIDNSDVERIVKAYQQNWSMPPDSATLKKLLAEEVKSEVFYREALNMQLDHNDEIIRRRLKQKYEFLVKDLADSQQPSEAALKTFYQENTEFYKAPAKLSFTQIYFSPDKRDNPLQDAQKMLSQYNASAVDKIDAKQLGDNFHLQNYFADRDYNDVRQLFGLDFTKALFEQKKEGWSIIKSGYGVHLVNISGVQQETVKSFEAVQDRVVADWKLQQQRLYNERLYENLLKKYEVEYAFE